VYDLDVGAEVEVEVGVDAVLRYGRRVWSCAGRLDSVMLYVGASGSMRIGYG